MNNDFISNYKKQHNLSDEWERNMRTKVKVIEEEKKNPLQRNTNDFFGDCDHPNTLEHGAATILYVAGMVGSLIFKDFWIPWFIFTIIYANFITRHDNN